MDKRLKQNLLLVIVGVGLFAALMNLSTVLHFIGRIIKIIIPVIIGGIAALFINVPMSGIEKRLRRLFRKRKKPLPDRFYRILSFILTLLGVALVLTLMFTLLIPELVNSGKTLYSIVETRLPEWKTRLESLDPDSEWLEGLLRDLNIDKIMNSLSESADILFAGVARTVSSAATAIMSTSFGLIIGIYLVLGKEQVLRQAKAFAAAYFKPAISNLAFRFCRKFSLSFAKFLSGQCVEAVILGILMFLAFTVFRLPYASLVGVLTAICAIIPYVGAFISCVVSAFLVVLTDPRLIINCIIVYLAVQFIENQFIYPHVVGNSVGLSPLYTLIAAMIGGNLFGIIGIIFFIPLTAVIIDEVKDGTEKRLNAKKHEAAP